ncbi:integrator complex subunit 6 homolog [Aedes albopictus]|uniref:GIY-YIG domain-containing protein n=1 Tax=Aedes albopictus TaxID=7160 RepID=A0ABM2A2N0_AEDAL
MKINVATNFIRRVTSLTTSTSIDQQKQIIFQVLRQNNYPSSLINRLLTRSTTNIATPPTMPTAQAHTIPPSPPSTQPPTPPPPPPPPPTPPLPSQPPVPASASSMSSPMQDPSQPTSTSRVQPNASNHESHHQSSETIYRSVPNIPILSRTLAEILKKDYPLVKIAAKTVTCTKHLLKNVKDPIPPLEQHNIIYSIPCSDCDNVYIGMTTNHLKKRLAGHKSNINKTIHMQNTSPQNCNIQITTALVKHIVENQHTFNLANTTIIDRTYKSTALPILEMCHITNTPNTVNFRTDVDGLNTAYAGILHTIKNQNSRRDREQAINEST